MSSSGGSLFVGFFLVAISLWGLLTLGGEMLEGETLAIDRRVLLALRSPGDLNDPIGPRGLEEAMRDITGLGGATLVTLVVSGTVIALWRATRRYEAAVVAIVVIGAQLSANLLKTTYDRPRPDLVPHHMAVYSESFPSGHSSVAACAYLILAVVLARGLHARRDRAALYILALVLIFCIGLSRIYLGVHWPSDVLAGWTLGAGWAVLGGLTLSFTPAQTRSVRNK
ncbi:MAG: hypothetical protein A2352_09300 [Caulobacterales bacterium RIFOXYB1_FULL_67_16]|nr:MAG: hypothetical protein A2352_09300 [Caulobacterales bacterium RIFOXYB1_FULL_67_16]